MTENKTIINKAFMVLEYRGQIVPISGVVHVGRDSNCDLVLSHDTKVSPIHARITSYRNNATLEDLHSSNGIHVNGMRIAQCQLIKPGDILRFGDQRIAVTTALEARLQGWQTCQECPKACAPEPENFKESELGTDRDGLDRYRHKWQQIERCTARGQWMRAAELLRDQLKVIASAIEENRRLPQTTQEQVCRHTIDMALATGQAKWLEALVDLHRLALTPLPSATTTNFPQLLHLVSQFNLSYLRTYIDTLRETQADFSLIEQQLYASLEVALDVAGGSKEQSCKTNSL